MRNEYKFRTFICLLFGAIAPILSPVFAQNNHLTIGWRDAASAPRFLNVCGDAQTVTAVVRTEGVSSTTRANVTATVQLFKGIRLMQFNAAGSTAGVTLMDNSNPNRPVFRLPNLDPNNLSSVNISYSMVADCGLTDSLSRNDSLAVVDKWNFAYQFGNQSFTETDAMSSYRDAIKVPYITMSSANSVTAGLRINDCFTRTMTVTNSATEGFLKTFEYTNTQGAGITITHLTVNGQQIPVTKTPLFNGDTIVKAVLSGNVFRFNTRGSAGTLADQDTLFEPNETVTIIENACVANCSRSRLSTQAATWGCFDRFCNSVTRQDLVRLADGVIYVGFQPSGTIPSVTGGYCKKGVSTVTFTNNGVEIDAGTAVMKNIVLGIGLGNNASLTDNAFYISKITIGNTVILNSLTAMIDLRNHPQLRNDPDGNGGLADLDGDGYYDDLPKGASVQVSVEYQVQCGAAGAGANCVNDFQTSFGAQIDYDDFCGRRNNFIRPQYFAPLNTNDGSENGVDPDAFTNNKLFYIEHKERRNIFNFEKDCNGQEQMIVKVRLTNGITAVPDSTILLRYTDRLRLLNSRISNDTLYMAFDLSGTTYLNADYTLKLAFRATCGAVPGATAFPMAMEFYCPPCECRHTYYCDTLKGPRIHYAEPPCVPNAIYDCTKGLKTTAFKAERTTFGYTDKTYTTKINPARANAKSAIQCDSVRMTVFNVVGQTSLLDSLGVVITYENSDRTATTNRLNDIFTFGKARIRVVKAGQSYFATIDASKVTVERRDSIKKVKFDLNDALTGLGLGLLNAGDSVHLYADFSVNPDGPYTRVFKRIPELRGYGFYKDGGNEYYCDNFGEVFTLGKVQTTFQPATSAQAPKGCEEAGLTWQIININNGFNDQFPNEYRQAVALDSIVLNYDPAFVTAFSTKVQVAMVDHPIYGNQFFDLANLDGSGRYVAYFDTLRRVPSYNAAYVGTIFTLKIKALPNCRSLQGSALGNNRFEFKPTIYYKDRFYANEIGDGSCALRIRDSRVNDIYYTEPPQITFTPVTTPNPQVANDTATWVVKVCNTSAKGNAGVTFVNVVPNVAVPDGFFKVVSVRDITNQNNVLRPIVQYYGNAQRNAFAYLNGLTVATPDKTIDDICNIVEVRAEIRNCGRTDVAIKTGWNCQAFPNNWNPNQYAPCNELIINGFTNTATPFLDATYLGQSLSAPALCDTTTLDVLLKNADLGKVRDVRTRFTVPILGGNLVPNSIEIAYPSGAPFRRALGNPTFVGSDMRGKIYEYRDFALLDTFLHRNGLKGFNSVSPNDSNEFKIRYKFTNDCQFRSGSLSYFSFDGKTNCGTPTNYELGESLPLVLRGAELSAPKLYSVSFGSGSSFVPNGVSYIEVDFKNLENTLSDSTDKVSVRLPRGIRYMPNSTQVISSPLTWNAGEPRQTTVDGMTILTWYQPIGLRRNDEVVFRFNVLTPDSMPCDNSRKDIGVVTLAEKALACAINNTTCLIEIITTSGGEHFFPIPVTRGSIVISSNIGVAGANTLIINGFRPIRLSAFGAQTVRWVNVSDNNAVIGNDSILNFTPTLATTTLRAESGVTTSCITPAEVRINVSMDTIPPHIWVRDTTIDCSEAFPTNFPRVTDDIDSSFSITFRDSTIAIPCGLHLVRTWVATDRAGNRATVIQNIIRRDNTPPTIRLANPIWANVRTGDTIEFNCTDNPNFQANDAIATDNCSNTPTIIFRDVARLAGDCVRDGYLVLMTCEWTAQDTCGNVSKLTIYLRFRDNDVPRFVNPPQDLTVSSVQQVPIVPTLTATDLCDTMVDITFREVRTDTTVVRTWIAKDDCGHAVPHVQTIHITVRDTIKPDITLTNYRNGDTLNIDFCTDTLFYHLNSVRVTDNLDPNPTVTLDSTTRSGNCLIDGFLFEKVYTWTARDRSGNSNTFRLTIRYVDQTAPVMVGVPQDVTLQCAPTPPVPEVLALDNCDGQTYLPVLFTENQQVINGDTIITRTWTTQDDCGNRTTKTQKITKKTCETGCSGLIPMREHTLRLTNCVGTATWCLNVAYATLQQYGVIDNGAPYTNGLRTCNNGTLFELGFGDHQLIFVNLLDNTCRDTVLVKVVCNDAVRDWVIRDTIWVRNDSTLCFNALSQVRGQILSARNLCDSLAHGFVGYQLDTLTHCLKRTGLIQGQDTACIEICTDSLGCNILHIYTTVLNRDSLPIARDDSGKTYKNRGITLQIMKNDSINGRFRSITIVQQPTYGTVRLVEMNGKWIAEYEPATEYCDSIIGDHFTYRLCNTTGCDDAIVTIKVLCDNGLTIYNGVSPDGDGANDRFTIVGIENYPNNELSVYSRWGTMVYAKKAYKNEWDGTWNNKNLPDGTYFYRLALGDGTFITGYLQIGH
jgi:gliding motility-associated-like protein